MSYIGNTQQNQSFVPQVDFFSGNGVTTAFTLSRTPQSVYALEVVVANVVQNPSDAYTVSGFDIIFTSVPPASLPITVVHGAYGTFVPNANVYDVPNL